MDYWVVLLDGVEVTTQRLPGGPTRTQEKVRNLLKGEIDAGRLDRITLRSRDGKVVALTDLTQVVDVVLVSGGTAIAVRICPKGGGVIKATAVVDFDAALLDDPDFTPLLDYTDSADARIRSAAATDRTRGG